MSAAPYRPHTSPIPAPYRPHTGPILAPYWTPGCCWVWPHRIWGGWRGFGILHAPSVWVLHEPWGCGGSPVPYMFCRTW